MTRRPAVRSSTFAHGWRSAARTAQRDAEQLLQLGDRLLGVDVVDGRHPERPCRLEVAGQVVHEDAVLRRQPDALRAQRVDRRVGLAHALLAGDHPAVEQLGQRRVVVAGRAPRVRDHAGPHAGVLRRPQPRPSSPRRAPCRAKRRSIRPRVGAPRAPPRSAPRSRPRRACRARGRTGARAPRGRSMNASRTRASSSPSAAQNCANDAKTFVVSTPPKSTSRPFFGAVIRTPSPRRGRRAG